MARCNIDALIKKVGIDKLSKEVEVSFALHRNLPDCRKINTRYYIGGGDSPKGGEEKGLRDGMRDAESFSYNGLQKPKNRFECMRKGCVNTGTLLTDAANAQAVFRAQFDAVDFAAGAVSFYVYAGLLNSSDFPLTLTFTIGDSDALTDADVYTKTIQYTEVTDDGFIPVVIDLSKTPTSTTGTGWGHGAVSYIGLSTNKQVGYSSIAIFDSIEDFMTNDVVKVGCLSDIGGSFDVPAIAATCLNSGYDDSVDSFTYNVTGTTVTPNYWKLNPMHGKGSATRGFEIVTLKKTVTAKTVTGVGNYGVITLSDLANDECGYITVQKADDCDVTDSFFKQISVPNLIALAEDQFQAIRDEQEGVTYLYFNANAAVGAEVIVSYPKSVEVEEEVLASENIGEIRVRMSVPVTTTDGVRYIYIFDNVLITSFPFTINNSSETSFNFTITIQRDDDGYFVRRRRIIG